MNIQNKQFDTNSTGQIAIYQEKNGKINVDVKISEDTVWLSLNQIAEIFERDKSVISRHLKNIFKEGELLENAVVAKNATTAADGKTYQVEYYNLDAILSVGYRVNSKRGVQFRQWASNILKEYLIKGYSINQQKITEEKIKQLQQTVELLSNTLINHNLVDKTGYELLSLIKAYSKTWQILVQYDEESLIIPNAIAQIGHEILNYETASNAVVNFKRELQSEAGNLFGLERDHGLKAILGNLEQTFDGESLYKSIEEKAAHLLYFIIKDHPFSDGNKRIGSLLFLLYLSKAKISLNKINPNGMIALALLTAESDPGQKEILIKLIVNLISNDLILN